MISSKSITISITQRVISRYKNVLFTPNSVNIDWFMITEEKGHLEEFFCETLVIYFQFQVKLNFK